MDLVQAMRTTAATREFTGRRVDHATVARILDNARFAPSGGNAQGWHVIVVDDVGTRRELARLSIEIWDRYIAERAAGYRPFNPIRPAPADTAPLPEPVPHPVLARIEEVPAVLVVSVDLGALAMFDLGLDRPAILGGASIYPFVHNIVLAARAEGLGGVIMTFLGGREAEAKTLLDLPEHHAIAAMVAIGEPVHQPSRLRRDPVESFATIDSYAGLPLAP